jgi:Glucose-6-phosphate dehydrogenase, NAD binding domain/Integrase core domain
MTGNGAPRAFKQADPCSLVVFGASGDLMHRLLVPALYNLAAGGLLPDAFALIGVGRSEMSDDALREDLRKSLQQFATRPVEEKIAERVVGCATYVRGDVDDPVSYDRLRQALQRIEAERGTKGNRLFYMATPPSAFRPIACQLGRSRLACEENGSWRRIIIEKPFGTDLASARKLNNDLLDVFDENQLNKPIAPGSPWQNGFAERLIGSIRRECVDHVVVLGESHLRRILTKYAAYYNELRTHRSLNKDAPIYRAIQHAGCIVSAPVLGGLHYHYCRI